MAEVLIDEAALREYVMERSAVFLARFTDLVTAQAKARAPVRSGELKAKIASQPVRRTGPWTVSGGVESLAKHSAPVHNGARPHVIRARNAPALSFYWPKVGRRVFFKSVNHPGQKAQPFLSDAAEAVLHADPQVTVGTS